ncbi:MAG: T9SS type A sorting domain-containing protein [Bacteroidetes bacterium]|nr:T9SS type A sorting domain-containing protein [Bacteroidota bacterium]
MKKLLSKLIIIVLILSGGTAKSQYFTNYTTLDGLPDNFIVGGVAVDNDNNKWFGTAAGVALYDNSIWKSFTTADGLIDNYSTAIAVDKDNNVWVGTNLGVSKFDGITWTSYTVADGLIDNAIVYIAIDSDSSVWFATSIGASRYKNSVWTDYTTVDGLPTDVLTYIGVDNATGDKWFATQMQGVSMFDNSIFTNYNVLTMDSLLDNNVFAVAADQDGQKWIGTWYGITLLDNANNWVENIRFTDGLYNDYVRDIKVDANNNIWVGMFADYNLDGGISGFDGTNWYSYSIGEGLVDKQVIRLAIDKTNNVWIATGNGVSKMSADELGVGTNVSEVVCSVFPNPAADVINVSVKGIKVNTIKLINTMGKEILQTSKMSINVKDVSNGVYFLKVVSDKEEVVKKIIINHN